MPKYDDATLKELGGLLTKMSSDPETRRIIAPAVKKHAPNIRFPDIEQSSLEQRIDQRFEAKEVQDEQNKALRGLAKQRAKVHKEYGDEGLKEIEDLMVKYATASYEAGAKLYSADLAPEVGRPESHNANWELPSGVNFKEALADPFKYGRQAAYDAIDEMRGKRHRMQ